MPRYDGNTRPRNRPKHRAHRMRRRTRFQRKMDRLIGGRKYSVSPQWQHASTQSTNTANAEEHAERAYQGV